MDDLSRLIYAMKQKKCSGEAFNIGGGKLNEISLMVLLKD